MAISNDTHRQRLGTFFDYEQPTDPGAVGAGKTWLDTTDENALVTQRRNAANSAWVNFGGSSGNSLYAPFIFDLKRFAESNGTNAADFVVGDGATNDNTAFLACVTAALASTSNMIYGYHVIYIPEDCIIYLDNPTMDSNLLFVGAGRNSGIKQDGNNAFMTFTNKSHYGFTNLSFDYAGGTQFGGLRNFGGDGVWIFNCDFWDSAPAGLDVDNGDRFGIVFGGGGLPSKNVYFGYNHIQDLQCEFDFMQGLLVEFNTSVRAPTTCAMGTFGINSGDVCKNLTYRHNKIIDPHSKAIQVCKDTFAITDTVFKNIAVYGNEITFRTYALNAFFCGTGTVASAQTTDTFEDIWFNGNTINYGPDCPDLDINSSIISFLAPNDAAGFVFNRAHVLNNTVNGNRRTGSWAIDARHFQNSRIEGNRLYKVQYGISPHGRVLNNNVQHNVIEATYGAGAFSDSLGNNIFDDTNKVLNWTEGASAVVFSDSTTGDVLEQPTQVNTPDCVLTGYAAWTPGAINNGASGSVDVAVNGATHGYMVVGAAFTLDTQGLSVSAKIKTGAAGVVTVTLTNATGGNVTLGAGHALVELKKPMF